MSKKNILFVKPVSTNAGFILNDIAILKEKYEVDIYNAQTQKNIFIIASLLNQFFHHILNIKKYSLIYIWFGDYHSFIPVFLGKIFKVKSAVCIGGFDATDIPEIECGAFSKDSFKKIIRKFMLEYSLRNTDKILAVDESLLINENKYIYSDLKGKVNLKDGILNFIPGIKDKTEVLYTGFDPDYFRKDLNVVKDNIVLSVGYTPNENEFRRKGIDELLKAADIMSDVNFVFVGLNESQIRKIDEMGFKNVKAFSFLKMDDLKSIYSRSKVYAQLSMFEGQPNSLCEAMMCECIPVGSDVNGIPGVIGGTGFIVFKKDTNEIVLKLRQALNAPDKMGENARKRIIENFSLDRRKKNLLRITEELIEK